MKLVPVAGGIKGRLVSFQMKYLDPMMENSDARIKIPGCATKLKKLLDFQKCPRPRKHGRNEGYFDDVRGLGS